MFVVRIQNDEATLFRAFRRLSTARRWAGERNAEDAGSRFDIFDVAGAPEASSAVTAAHSGKGIHVHRLEAMSVPAWIVGAQQAQGTPSPSDHVFA